MSRYDELKRQYPPTISADQFRQICHISKRKATWLLENGVVPCKDSGKKTRRFTIYIDDVIKYLQARENDPDSVITPRGQFTSGPKRRSSIPIEKLETHLQTYWALRPDTLTIQEIRRMTGYSERLIGEWVRSGRLVAVTKCSQYLIPKTALIEFLAAAQDDPKFFYSDKFMLIIEKM